MTPLDWALVIAINGGIVVWGLRFAGGTKTAYDWLLAAKGLPWWIVGLSLFATAVDSGDYVAVVGGSYNFGLQNIAAWWIGMPVGWFLVGWFIFLPIYRAGCFTNSEYLEQRFSPSVRLLAALIQIQYRTNVLGNIAYSLYLTFSIATGWGDETWALVVIVAAAAGVYTAAGGLKAVAMTDAVQALFIALASGTLWWTLWSYVGGWSGLEARLAAQSPELAHTMLHLGARAEPGAPAILVMFGWAISLTAYVVVNHSQAMRLLAARSEWDMRAAAAAASFALAFVMWCNISLGVLARAVYPDLAVVDEAFPRMVKDFLAPGLLGLVVAGVLAGAISTYDSIGSALAAVFTRDIYGRFLVKDADDARMLRVSRWSTVAFLAISFAYIPFLRDGMVAFYLRITSVAVMPLFAVYMMGALTRVHPGSGVWGLGAGVLYGLSSFAGEAWGWNLPLWWTSTWWSYLWAIVIPAVTMFAYSLARGWDERPALPPEPPQFHPWYARPSLWAAVFFAIVGSLVVWLW
ncbi:MAG: hypothetical protein H6509_09670 [Bryobacterales bacterium]|nr:hypothetical protein [Bryobacterales bacterium]